MAGKKSGLHMVTFILLVVGGLNWLLVGVLQWDVGALFGGMDNIISRIIYILVGLSAIYELATHKKCCGVCGKKDESSAPAGPVSGGDQGGNQGGGQ